jgi:hypothetical protein
MGVGNDGIEDYGKEPESPQETPETAKEKPAEEGEGVDEKEED